MDMFTHFLFRKKNDKLEYAILQTNFYLLPLDLQRDFKFMINIVQKAKSLKVAGAELNITLFVAVGHTLLQILWIKSIFR